MLIELSDQYAREALIIHQHRFSRVMVDIMNVTKKLNCYFKNFFTLYVIFIYPYRFTRIQRHEVEMKKPNKLALVGFW